MSDKDTIYRQAAIDTIKRTDVEGISLNDVIAVTEVIARAVEKLPSAQPYTDEEIQKMQDMEQAQLEKAFELGREDAKAEIVRCKDCKHRGEKPISDGRYWCKFHNSFMYYCSDAMPTIKPERKMGKWVKAERDGVIVYSDAYAQCSMCKEVTFLGWEMKYCPNCGAKMVGDGNDYRSNNT